MRNWMFCLIVGGFMFGWLNAAQGAQKETKFARPSQELNGWWAVTRIEIPRGNFVHPDIQAQLLQEPMLLPLGQVIHIKSIGPYIVTRTLTAGPETEIKSAEMVEITLQPPFSSDVCQHDKWGVFCYDVKADVTLEKPTDQTPKSRAAYAYPFFDKLDPDVLKHGNKWGININPRVEYVFQFEDYSIGEIRVHPAGDDCMVWTFSADTEGSEGVSVGRIKAFVAVVLKRTSMKNHSAP